MRKVISNPNAYKAMLPRIHTGIFLTLGLLLSRRAEAGNEICQKTGDWGCCFQSCCQDNTWDIAVSGEPIHNPVQNAIASEGEPQDESTIEVESFFLCFKSQAQSNLVKMRRRSWVQPLDSRFGNPPFHPPSAN